MGNGTTVIRGGTVHDGRGGPGLAADVVVRDGVIAEILGPGSRAPAGRVLDAGECWVTPGFVDVTGHGDLHAPEELLAAAQHGVTTTLLGAGAGGPVATPWASPGQYLHRLRQQPLGTNVAALLPHGTIRAQVLGAEASVTRRADQQELLAMGRLVQAALEDGYLGISLATDGDVHQEELRFLVRLLRRYGAILRATPRGPLTWDHLWLATASTGRGRAPLRTIVTDGGPAVGAVGRLTNTLLGGALRVELGAAHPLRDHPDALLGGALRVLARVVEEQEAGTTSLTIGQAVHRCTAELTGYLGIDGGLVHEGRPADLCVVDPMALRAGDEKAAVRAAFVNGQVVWSDGEASDVLGVERVGQLRLPVDRPLGAVGRAEARAAV